MGSFSAQLVAAVLPSLGTGKGQGGVESRLGPWTFNLCSCISRTHILRTLSRLMAFARENTRQKFHGTPSWGPLIARHLDRPEDSGRWALCVMTSIMGPEVTIEGIDPADCVARTIALFADVVMGGGGGAGGSISLQEVLAPICNLAENHTYCTLLLHNDGLMRRLLSLVKAYVDAPAAGTAHCSAWAIMALANLMCGCAGDAMLRNRAFTPREEFDDVLSAYVLQTPKIVNRREAVMVLSCLRHGPEARPFTPVPSSVDPDEDTLVMLSYSVLDMEPAEVCLCIGWAPSPPNPTLCCTQFPGSTSVSVSTGRDPVPVSLYNPHTTTSSYILDHKDCCRTVKRVPIRRQGCACGSGRGGDKSVALLMSPL